MVNLNAMYYDLKAMYYDLNEINEKDYGLKEAR